MSSSNSTFSAFMSASVSDLAKAPFLDPWTYTSRTKRVEERANGFSRCFAYPLFTGIYLTVFPLAWPLFFGLSSVLGINAFRTMTFHNRALLPEKEHYLSEHNIVAYKRVYDELLEKPVDHMLTKKSDIDEALRAVGTKRRQYIQDPSGKKVWYFVFNQSVMKTEHFFDMEFQMMNIFYDAVAFIVPMFICLRMRVPGALMATDIKLVLQGRLSILNIRSPLFNIFKTQDQLRKDKARVVVTKNASLGQRRQQ